MLKKYKKPEIIVTNMNTDVLTSSTDYGTDEFDNFAYDF